MSIKTQIQHLAELQKVENDISAINHLLGQIPAEVGALDQQLSDFKTTIETAQIEINTFEKKYRDWEGQSRSILANIGKEEEKLRAVKNNKEHQALLTGIEHLKKEQSTTEDRMIESLEAIDDAKVNLVEQEEAFKRLETKLLRQKEMIERRTDKKRTQLEGLQKTKLGIVAELAPDILGRYQHVKRLKGNGLAVALVLDAVCKGCNMNIPPQLYNELQRHERLLMCPNCQRIIYHVPPDETATD